MPAAIIASPSGGTAKTPSTSTWRITTDGRQPPSQRPCAHASGRASARSDAPGPRFVQGGDRPTPPDFPPDPLRYPRREAAGDARDGAAPRQVPRQRPGLLAQPAARLRSPHARAEYGEGACGDRNGGRVMAPVIIGVTVTPPGGAEPMRAPATRPIC